MWHAANDKIMHRDVLLQPSSVALVTFVELKYWGAPIVGPPVPKYWGAGPPRIDAHAPSHRPRMLSSSMPSGLFTQQDSSGSSPSRESRTYQIQVTGAGNGMPEATSGCHIGQICQTSARLAHCSSNAGVWLSVRVTACVIKLDSIALHCASAKGTALIMKVKCDVHATLLFCFDDVYNWNGTFSLHKSSQYHVTLIIYYVITKICVCCII